MIQKLPSLQATYLEYFSGDPAFQQKPGDNATEGEKKKYAEKLKRARERGDWAELRVEGAPPPTAFEVRPLPGDFVRKLVGMLQSGKIDLPMFPQFAFRKALVDVENFGDFEMSRETHPTLGELASTAVANKFDAIDPVIITEIGNAIWERGTQGISPL